MHKRIRKIHKYANRKMYDTVARCFVTLGDILAMVRRGVEVMVIDKATGRDITPLVLARAMAREAEAAVERAKQVGNRELERLLREIKALGEEVKRAMEVRNGGCGEEAA